MFVIFYTDTFWGLKVLHSKVHKFATKVTSRQNSVNHHSRAKFLLLLHQPTIFLSKPNACGHRPIKTMLAAHLSSVFVGNGENAHNGVPIFPEEIQYPMNFHHNRHGTPSFETMTLTVTWQGWRLLWQRRTGRWWRSWGSWPWWAWLGSRWWSRHESLSPVTDFFPTDWLRAW